MILEDEKEGVYEVVNFIDTYGAISFFFSCSEFHFHFHSMKSLAEAITDAILCVQILFTAVMR